MWHSQAGWSSCRHICADSWEPPFTVGEPAMDAPKYPLVRHSPIDRPENDRGCRAGLGAVFERLCLARKALRSAGRWTPFRNVVVLLRPPQWQSVLSVEFAAGFVTSITFWSAAQR